MSLSLNRWLTRNRVNKIGRTRGYFVMPSFDITYAWGGYSDIVLVLNYTASRNFSLINPARLRNISTAFTLCIAWADSNGVVYRYKLNTGVGEVIYANIPAYTNQLIKKNFRLEVWSTPALLATTTADIVVNTSALGSEDTRQGVDFSLGTAIVVDSGFGSTGTAVTEPPQTGLTIWLDYQLGLTKVGNDVSAWEDQASGIVFTQVDNTKRPTQVTVVDGLNGVEFLGTQFLTAQQASVFGDVFLFFVTHIGAAAANNQILGASGVNGFDASGYTVYSFCGSGVTDHATTTALNGNFRSVSLPQVLDGNYSDDLITIVRITPYTSNTGQSLLRSYSSGAGTLADQDAPVVATVGNISCTVGNLILGDSAGVAIRGFILKSVLAYGGICPDVAGVMSYFNTCLDMHSIPVPLIYDSSVVVPSNT